MDVGKWLANKQVFLMFISRFAKKEKSTEIFCIGANWHFHLAAAQYRCQNMCPDREMAQPQISSS